MNLQALIGVLSTYYAIATKLPLSFLDIPNVLNFQHAIEAFFSILKNFTMEVLINLANVYMFHSLKVLNNDIGSFIQQLNEEP